MIRLRGSTAPSSAVGPVGQLFAIPARIARTRARLSRFVRPAGLGTPIAPVSAGGAAVAAVAASFASPVLATTPPARLSAALSAVVGAAAAEGVAGAGAGCDSGRSDEQAIAARRGSRL